MTVYFVKLRNGEEVISQVHDNQKDVVMQDPMSLEYGGDTAEGKKMIFMTRYNPFCRDKTIRIPRHLVAYMGPVTPEVEEYYTSSLDYCRQVMDASFSRGMKSAARQTTELLVEDTQTVEEKVVQEILGPSANTTLH